MKPAKVEVAVPATLKPERTARLVVVAEVPVALRKVKSWRVLEPVSKRLPKYPVPVTVMAVDEAYGNTEAVVLVAVKYEPIMLFPRMSPATESFWPGVVVPIPTFPPVVAKYAHPVEEIAVVEA